MMVDTHVVYWLAESPEVLSRRARSAIVRSRSSGSLYIAGQTLWELAMLISRGKLRVTTTTQQFLETVEQQFQILPMTGAVAQRAMTFSAKYPKDPTDRIIGATALAHSLPLITRDEEIRRSGEVPCIW